MYACIEGPVDVNVILTCEEFFAERFREGNLPPEDAWRLLLLVCICCLRTADDVTRHEDTRCAWVSLLKTILLSIQQDENHAWTTQLCHNDRNAAAYLLGRVIYPETVTQHRRKRTPKFQVEQEAVDLPIYGQEVEEEYMQWLLYGDDPAVVSAFPDEVIDILAMTVSFDAQLEPEAMPLSSWRVRRLRETSSFVPAVRADVGAISQNVARGKDRATAQKGSKHVPRRSTNRDTTTQENVSCNGCKMSSLIGAHHRCLLCEDFGFCGDCIAVTTLREEHARDHPLFPIEDLSKGEPLRLAKQCHEYDTSIQPHHNEKCDTCQKQILGVHHKCLTCTDYNFCDSCINTQDVRRKHDTTHKFFPAQFPPNGYEGSEGYKAARHQHLSNNPPLPRYSIVVCQGCHKILNCAYFKCQACNYDFPFVFCTSCHADPIKRLAHNARHVFFPVTSTPDPASALEIASGQPTAPISPIGEDDENHGMQADGEEPEFVRHGECSPSSIEGNGDHDGQPASELTGMGHDECATHDSEPHADYIVEGTGDAVVIGAIGQARDDGENPAEAEYKPSLGLEGNSFTSCVFPDVYQRATPDISILQPLRAEPHIIGEDMVAIPRGSASAREVLDEAEEDKVTW